MISLRKHIEARRHPADDTSLADYRSALSSALSAMGECSQRAVPGLGPDLHRQLGAIEQTLGVPVTPGLLTEASASVKAELSNWADLAWQHHSANESEIREMIAVITRAGDAVAQRDRSYGEQLGDLNAGLRALAEMDDLPVLRRSILEGTRALQACVEKMAEDGRESILKLTGEVAGYRVRLEESERLSATDPLTGLPNRRAFGKELEIRTSSRQTFCLIMLDLNGFKRVNDRYGHIAGDDLLRQFAAELLRQFTAGDMVGRWGGDEFVALVAGPQTEGEAKAERVRRWVLGEYKIQHGDSTVKVPVQAALGVVEWDKQETGIELLARADRQAYAAKPPCR